MLFSDESEPKGIHFEAGRHHLFIQFQSILSSLLSLSKPDICTRVASSSVAASPIHGGLYGISGGADSVPASVGRWCRKCRPTTATTKRSGLHTKSGPKPNLSRRGPDRFIFLGTDRGRDSQDTCGYMRQGTCSSGHTLFHALFPNTAIRLHLQYSPQPQGKTWSNNF